MAGIMGKLSFPMVTSLLVPCANKLSRRVWARKPTEDELMANREPKST